MTDMTMTGHAITGQATTGQATTVLLDPARSTDLRPGFGDGYDLDDFGDAAQVAPCYGNVDAFVREYLRHMYKRRIDGRTRVWAARWWSYGEAISRLDALWRSWESLRQDPSTGMSVWWRDHADYHMPVLLDPDGVFFDAADDPANTNRRGEPLPYEPPPDGMFPDLR